MRHFILLYISLKWTHFQHILWCKSKWILAQDFLKLFCCQSYLNIHLTIIMHCTFWMCLPQNTYTSWNVFWNNLLLELPQHLWKCNGHIIWKHTRVDKLNYSKIWAFFGKYMVDKLEETIHYTGAGKLCFGEHNECNKSFIHWPQFLSTTSTCIFQYHVIIIII